MAVVSTARATWQGDLASGKGEVSAGKGAFRSVPVSWKTRTEGGAESTPEELLAAAHAACFSMALASRLAKAGMTVDRLDVEAKVTFDNAGGGWAVASSELAVKASVQGDRAKLAELAEDAKQNCPISKALAGNVRLAVKAEAA